MIIVKVFNSDKWRKNGGDCKELGCNNKCFYEEAEIIRGYVHDHDVVVDVRFKRSGYFSKGHFVTGLKFVDNESEAR